MSLDAADDDFSFLLEDGFPDDSAGPTHPDQMVSTLEDSAEAGGWIPQVENDFETRQWQVAQPVSNFVPQDIPYELLSDATGQLFSDRMLNVQMPLEAPNSALGSTSTGIVFGSDDLVPNLSVPPPQQNDFPFYQFPIPWLQNLEPIPIPNFGNGAAPGSFLDTTDLDCLDGTQFQIPVIALMNNANFKEVYSFGLADRDFETRDNLDLSWLPQAAPYPSLSTSHEPVVDLVNPGFNGLVQDTLWVVQGEEKPTVGDIRIARTSIIESELRHGNQMNHAKQGRALLGAAKPKR
jgi:hypothetical protein